MSDHSHCSVTLQALEDEGLQKTVLDYIKFEKRFREGYMASAAQIYISGLTFAPRESIVSCSYRPRFRDLIQASGALDIVWPPSEALVMQGMVTILSVAFSPDGTRIASGSVDKTIRVWDAATGQQVGDPLAGHTSSIRSVAFSPDGTRIASGSHDETIRVWDAATGQQVGDPLAGHTGSVRSVAFSPDGTRIASGLVASVAFSPDGTRIASGSDDKTIRTGEWSNRMVQFQNGWFHVEKDTSSYILWTPHTFRPGSLWEQQDIELHEDWQSDEDCEFESEAEWSRDEEYSEDEVTSVRPKG
ncbi:WD40-repeat-containing domain protein [Mycena olivaceomarginata]|nr:WD40-repeat-containing domain protein [Mycena olivaceomarginata]